MAAANVSPCTREKRVDAGALAQLAKGDDDIKKLLVDADAVPGLIPMLEHKDTTVVESALLALVNLTEGSEDIKQAVIAGGAVPALTKLCDRDDGKVAENALLALANLAASKKAQEGAVVFMPAAEKDTAAAVVEELPAPEEK